MIADRPLPPRCLVQSAGLLVALSHTARFLCLCLIAVCRRSRHRTGLLERRHDAHIFISFFLVVGGAWRTGTSWLLLLSPLNGRVVGCAGSSTCLLSTR